MKKCQRGVRKRSLQCEKVATYGRSNLPIGAEPEGTEHSIGIPALFSTSVCLRSAHSYRFRFCDFSRLHPYICGTLCGTETRGGYGEI